MSKVYCQNELCPYWRKSRLYKNYGTCKNKVIFMTWQQDDEYNVTGHNCECKESIQERIWMN